MRIQQLKPFSCLSAMGRFSLRRDTLVPSRRDSRLTAERRVRTSVVPAMRDVKKISTRHSVPKLHPKRLVFMGVKP